MLKLFLIEAFAQGGGNNSRALVRSNGNSAVPYRGIQRANQRPRRPRGIQPTTINMRRGADGVYRAS